MPARTFTRATIKWRACVYCGRDFPDSRKNRKYDTKTCRTNASRIRKRHKVIAKRGGRCEDCGKVFDHEYATPFYVLKDGRVVCGADLSRRSREKFHLRWPRGKTGYKKSKPPSRRLH
jgi:hypothetical protein